MQSKKIILLTFSFLFIFYASAFFVTCFATDSNTASSSHVIVDPTTGKITYILLEPGVGQATQIDTSGNLKLFLSSVYNFGVAAAAVLAVLMIAWGGVEYMTTEAFQGKSDAKNKIWNAIFGLLLVLASYLILWTINPNIINLPGSTLFK